MKFKTSVLVIALTLVSGGTAAQARGGEMDQGVAPHFQANALLQDSQAGPALEAGQGWEIQTPDPALETGLHGSSIVVDSQGRPRISYEFTRDFSQYDIDLRYAEWTGNRWDIQDVHRSFLAEPGGYRSALALDTQGKPHLTYHVEQPGGWRPIFLRHATRAAGWGEETLDEFSFGEFYDSSAAVDPTNRLHVLYTTRTSGFSGLRYAIVGGVNRLIEPGLVHITHNSLALNAIGRPYVAYHVFTARGDTLKYAAPIPGGWQTTVIDDALGAYGESAIAVDSQGQPRIAYVAPQENRVKYAVWNGTAWDIEIVGVDDGLNAGWYRSDISLVLGPGGTPHILYAGTRLNYATKLNGAWKISVLHPGPIGLHSDLALDTQGHLHASFFDWQERRLQYARSTFSVNPHFQVTAPRAGDTWVAGSTYTIAWQAYDMPEDAWVGGVRLWWDTLPVAEILPPHGQSPASGTLQWQVPANLSPGDYYLVEVLLNRGTPASPIRLADAWSGPFRVRRP